MSTVKRVYTFGNKQAEGNGKMRELLGGKGANLAEMNLVGIPVPPGFTITTEVCDYFYSNGKKYPASLAADVKAGVASVERQMGKTFGDERDPLLFSVRSGARGTATAASSRCTEMSSWACRRATRPNPSLLTK